MGRLELPDAYPDWRTVMTYQLRYLGESDQEPETLTSESLETALRTARLRLDQSGVTSVALMSDGFVVRTLTRTDGPLVTLDDQILANAGIYHFGPPPGGDRPAGRVGRDQGRGPADDRG